MNKLNVTSLALSLSLRLCSIFSVISETRSSIPVHTIAEMSHTSIDQKRISAVSVILVFFQLYSFLFFSINRKIFCSSLFRNFVQH